MEQQNITIEQIDISLLNPAPYNPRQFSDQEYKHLKESIIGCEQMGRKCYAMEFDPKYVDVGILRWEQFTHKKAVRLDIV